MVYDDNEVYVLNPDYIMRNDLHRIAVYAGERTCSLSLPDWASFLHPLHAKIFSFFTYDRPLKENIRLLSRYLKRDEPAVKKIISPFIENPTSVFTKYKEEKVLIPRNIIINRKRISSDVKFLNLTPDNFNCSDIDITTRRMYTGPQLLTFMLNNVCLSDCIYCYADKKTQVKKPISTSRILELIEEAKAMKVRLVNLQGGEVFLHHDWPVILKKLVDLHLSPEYLSTKCPLNDKIINALKTTGFTNTVQISLDACSSSVLQKMLSVKSDYLNKVIQGIKLIDNAGLKYRVTSVITTSNAQESVFSGLFRLLSGLKNITDWRITPAANSNCIEYSLFRKLKPKKEDIRSLYEFIQKEIMPYSNFPVLLNIPGINRKFYYCTTGSENFKEVECSALNTHLFVLPDGKVTICEQLYWDPRFIIGDLTKDKIAEVWSSQEAQRLANLKREDIRNESRCKTCRLFEPCFSRRNRCWADIVKAYGKENWDYPDPRCAYAPAMINELTF